MMANTPVLRACAAVALAMMLSLWANAVALSQDRPPEANMLLDSLEFKDAKLIDAIRIISELSGVNILATREAAGAEVSLFVRNTSAHNAIDGLARVGGLWYRYNRKTNTYLIMTARQFQDDLIVFREDFTRVFQMRHQNVEDAALIIEALFGLRVELTLDEDDNLLLDEFRTGAGGTGTGALGGLGQNAGRVDRFGNQVGRNRFDSRNRNNRFGANTQQTGGANRRAVDIINLEDELSPQQLSTLGEGLEGAPPGSELSRISAGRIQSLANREPPIFVTVNRLHNLVYVRTSDEGALEEIAKIIAETDRPTPQVLLEMKILELEVSDGFRSSFDFGFQTTSTTQFIDSNGNLAVAPEAQLGLGNFPLFGGTLLFQFINDQILAQIELLENENRINILATPMVLASNSTPAQLFIGEERVISIGAESTTTTGTTGASTTFIEVETEVRDIGTTLRILPRINSDRTVTLLVQQDNSTVNVGGASLAVGTDSGSIVQVPIDTVDTANIEGIVTAKDGFTVAIGGLIRKTSRDIEQKVPVLGDIPVMGSLFRTDDEEESKTELVLLITPHIFVTPAEAESQSRATTARVSSNPELDRTGFGASRNLNPVPDAASVENMVALTRFAAKKMKGAVPDQTDPDIIATPLSFSGSLQLMPKAAVGVVPQQSWRRGALYVTAVHVANHGQRSAVLNPQGVMGDWNAITFETAGLAPAGQTGSGSLAYFVSTRPFMDVVNNIGAASVGVPAGRLSGDVQ